MCVWFALGSKGSRAKDPSREGCQAVVHHKCNYLDKDTKQWRTNVVEGFKLCFGAESGFTAQGGKAACDCGRVHACSGKKRISDLKSENGSLTIISDTRKWTWSKYKATSQSSSTPSSPVSSPPSSIPSSPSPMSIEFPSVPAPSPTFTPAPMELESDQVIYQHTLLTFICFGSVLGI